MPLNTRTESYQLPSDAWVLRGGDVEAQDVSDSAEICFRKYEEYGLSVFAADVPDAADVFSRDPRIDRFPHGHYTSVRVLRAAGLPMRPTGRAPHYTVTLPDLKPTTIALFVQAFGNRAENPRLAERPEP